MNTQEILPSPEAESGPKGLEINDSSNEQELSKSNEQKSSSKSGFGAVAAVAVDDAQQQVQGVAGGIGAATITRVTDVNAPEIADDIDLIEKEWVKKAKDIVDSTQGDPYEQNNQMNKMKVEYIKKRYNKDIKLKEE